MTEADLYKELGALTKDKDRWKESIPYGKKTIGSKDTLESQSEERSPIAEETNERNDSEKAEHSGRPRVKNRLLNALIGKLKPNKHV